MKRFPSVLSALFLGASLCLGAASAQAQDNPEKPAMFTPILVATPTDDSAVLSIVNTESPLKGELRYRKQGAADWQTLTIDVPANSQENLRQGVKNYKLTGLSPATTYEYELLAAGESLPGGSGSFLTRRDKAEPFRFVIMTDAHVNPANPERNPVLRSSADTAAFYKPDFVLHAGDNMQTVGSTHGGPAAAENHPNVFHIYFRQVLGDLQSKAAQFVLNGNWEGENGWHPQPNRDWAKNARMAIMPAPDDNTYPEGGSKNQDYYAFTWGGALFVSLNATGYNSINHEHTRGEGGTDDWTLGKEQLAWLEKTLAESKATWKFLIIHHAVGGNAGDEVNSRYGRGGGRVAYIGEQAKVHEMMKKYGVEVFFYGHDHVFTDMVVDNIHYICCGSVGAPWKFGTEETGYEDYIPDSGFVLVDMENDKMTVRYIAPEQGKPEGKELYKVELKPAG